MHWSVGELYTVRVLQKINKRKLEYLQAHVFDRFDIKQSIAHTSKTYTLLDSPAHKKYEHICLVTVE